MRNFDVIIMGNGLAGKLQALALAQNGLQVALIGTSKARKAKDKRVLSINGNAWLMFDALGLSDDLRINSMPVRKIIVGEDPHNILLEFPSDREERRKGAVPADAGAEDYGAFDIMDGADEQDDELVPPLARTIAVNILERAFDRALQETPNIIHYVNAAFPGHFPFIERDKFSVMVTLTENWMTQREESGYKDNRKDKNNSKDSAVTNGLVLCAPLCIGADGRGSKLRQFAGIAGQGHSYAQRAIGAVVAHSKPHNNIAFQQFEDGAPLAFLPMVNSDDGSPTLPYRSAVIWSLSEARANGAMALNDALFLQEIGKRALFDRGEMQIMGARGAFPLHFYRANNLASDRIALIGEAAHILHPMAGQGFNLTIRDIASLTETILEQARLGLDIGGHAVLSEYESWRAGDIGTVTRATDLLVRLFGARGPFMPIMRATGMRGLNRIGWIKSQMIAAAGGGLGSVPKLLTGIQP